MSVGVGKVTATIVWELVRRAIAEKWGGGSSCGGSDWDMHEAVGGVVIMAKERSRKGRKKRCVQSVSETRVFNGATECEVRCQANALANGCVGLGERSRGCYKLVFECVFASLVNPSLVKSTEDAFSPSHNRMGKLIHEVYHA